ncbi:MAG: hypothetical protein IKE21_07940 [Erysipelotrichaceae bacterium]|nr:hypothetical protein [Erysipelotrichaceae bacterium]
MEEKHYCIFCGSPLTEGSDVCPSCRKQIPAKEDLFKEFLYRNTKDELKGKADDALFAVVKNWLLSHLYGLIVSFVFIGLAGIALSPPRLPSYIREVSSPARPAEQTVSETPQAEEERLHSEDLSAATAAANGFTDSIFYNAVTGNGEREVHIAKFEDGPPPPPEAYYIPKTYDAYPVSSYFFIDASYPHIMTSQSDWIRTNEPTTELGKTLRADGFPIVEFEVTNTYAEGSDEDAPAIRSDRFLFVLTRMDGEWYIAETLPVDPEG